MRALEPRLAPEPAPSSLNPPPLPLPLPLANQLFLPLSYCGSAGVRGVDLPKEEALQAAARAAVSWAVLRVADAGGGERAMTARFGVQDSVTAHALSDAVEDAIGEAVTERGDGALSPLFEVAEPPPKARERWAV